LQPDFDRQELKILNNIDNEKDISTINPQKKEQAWF